MRVLLLLLLALLVAVHAKFVEETFERLKDSMTDKIVVFYRSKSGESRGVLDIMEKAAKVHTFDFSYLSDCISIVGSFFFCPFNLTENFQESAKSRFLQVRRRYVGKRTIVSTRAIQHWHLDLHHHSGARHWFVLSPFL
jgi:hypothetical protein